MNRIQAPSRNTRRHAGLLLLALVLTPPATLPAVASQTEANDNLQKWLVRRLNDPTPQERAHEQSGNVYVYDGLTDREVERAMNAHFDRIEYMMFVGTRRTTDLGSPGIDASGSMETESPGCGDN